MSRYLLAFSCFMALVSYSSSLECFACHDQDSNQGKCRKTTKQCEEAQDACRTYIRWGVPPYWTPRGDRIYYITKDCDTLHACDDARQKSATHCKRDWYNDWACVECCSGDLCNFYVTMGSSEVKSSITTIASSLTALIVTWRLL